MKTITQKDRIFDALKLGKRCGTDFLRWEPPVARYAARIHELREDGHEIVTEPCKLHNHESNQIVYRLVDQAQGELF